MVNEAEEYLRVLPYLQKGEVPPVAHPLHYHLVWLLDAAGHSGAIESSLDQVEYQLRKKSEKFTKDFQHFYLKAVEMAGYLRTDLEEFPALNRFNRQVDLELTIFKEFLRELEELELDKEALGTFSPLMADHMAREECYYLTKVAESSDLELPNCDPTKPRTEV